MIDLIAPDIPKLLWLRATYAPKTPAYRFCYGTIWRSMTFASVLTEVQRLYDVLQRFGIHPGERVGLWSANCVEWILCDFAILAHGAITVPIHAQMPLERGEQQLRSVGATALISSRPEHVGELLFADKPLRLCPFDADTTDVPDFVAECPSPIATIVFTSGTSGPGKAVTLTHRNMLFNAQAAQAVLPFQPGTSMLNFLPFSHIYARVSDVLQSLIAGTELILSDSAHTAQLDLQQLQPHYFRAVPSFYEQIYRSSQTNQPPVPEVLTYWIDPSLAENRQLRLRHRFGHRIRRLYVGGAKLPHWLEQEYLAAGLTILQGYGLTETSPTICVNREREHRIGTVGRPLPGVAIRIADDGEILTRGPHVFLGYWNDPEATRQVLQDGWFHTGDLGEIDEAGFLTVTGRKSEQIVLSTGRKLMPTRVEQALTRLPGVTQAVVVGEGCPYPIALIVTDAEVSSAEPIDWPALAQSRLRNELAPWEIPRRFLPIEPLSVATGELTVTGKICREVIQARYADQLNALAAELSR